MKFPLKIRGDGYGTKLLILLSALIIILMSPLLFVPAEEEDLDVPGPEEGSRLFEVQAIDTMKYSRDLARQMLKVPSFDNEIDSQMKLIKDAGATHVAIDTPYDDEFLPMLRRWEASARKHGLSVWFRGNFSGWEGWFGYRKITPEEHKEMLSRFIAANADLFEDGDIFSSCPECENGGPGDPRKTGDTSGYNQFLLDEHEIAQSSFRLLEKDIKVMYSMNADIAQDELRLATAGELGNGILIDHYVTTSDQFISDVASISDKLGAPVGIGEFGSPIPDIHGPQTEAAQAAFIGSMLRGLYENDERAPVINYWTLKGGTTALVNANGLKKKAYGVISSYFKAVPVSGTIKDEKGNPLKNAVIKVSGTSYTRKTDDEGRYRIFVPSVPTEIVFSKSDRVPATTTVDGSKGPLEIPVILIKM